MIRYKVQAILRSGPDIEVQAIGWEQLADTTREWEVSIKIPKDQLREVLASVQRSDLQRMMDEKLPDFGEER